MKEGLNMKYYMGIDIGSFESKGMLIDENGTVIATHSVAHVMETIQPGYAEHDAEKVWWNDFCVISKTLIQKSDVAPEDIKGVGCSAIGPCCLPVNENNKPLRKAILYGIDTRAKHQIQQLNEELGEEYVLKKYGNPITSQSVGPKILWIKQNEPEIYEKTAKFITSTTYLVAKLTDEYYIDNYTAAYFTPMYNLETCDWDYENLGRFCRPDQLAKCLWTDEIAGKVTRRASEETGLAEGTEVTVGTADAAADAVGVGVFNPGDMMAMFGSSLYMIHVVPKLITDRRYWAGPYLFKDTYMVASGMSTSGTLTRWFRDQFTPDFIEIEKNSGQNAYELLTESIENIPAGSEGLIVLPYLSGERTPINDPAAKGVIVGLTLQHTRAHIYQACLEAIGYGIEQHLRGYSEIGIKTNKIYVVGGGTKAPKWMQIVSDITNRELYVGGTFGAAYGDCLLAALGTGCIPDIKELQSMIGNRGKIVPNKENNKVYKSYVNNYIKLYEVTKDIMHQL
jgi:xylulokinase